MAQLVYIKELGVNTFIHFSEGEGENYYLRDFSKSETTAPKPQRDSRFTAQQIMTLANQLPNRIAPYPQGHPITEIKFWHDYVCQQNQEVGLVPSVSWIERMKKHPVIVALGGLVGIVILLGTFTGALDKIIEFLRKHFGG